MQRLIMTVVVCFFAALGAFAQATVSEKPELSMQHEATTTTTPSFVFAVVSGGGLARLSLINGAVQFCQLTDGEGRSTSRCVKIGAVPVNNLASAQMTFVPFGHVVITNPITGVMVDCFVEFNAGFIAGTPAGNCLTLTPGS